MIAMSVKKKQNKNAHCRLDGCLLILPYDAAFGSSWLQSIHLQRDYSLETERASQIQVEY